MCDSVINAMKGALWSLLAAGLAAGCVRDDDAAPSGTGAEPAVAYVSFGLASPHSPSTRVGPAEGDGTEKGQDYENAVTTAVAFFYDAAAGGVNGSGAVPVTAVGAFAVAPTGAVAGYDAAYTSGPVKVELPDGTYSVLVVANPDSAWWEGRTLTLSDVRDHILKRAWQGGRQEGYSGFVMTSAADATLTLHSNPYDNPAAVTVEVGRVAARFDYMAEARYECLDSAFAGAEVVIEGAALVNDMKAGSYLARRVADRPDSATPDYLGPERTAGGKAANYVVDPWTAAKTASADGFEADGVQRPFDEMYGIWFGAISDDPRWWAGAVTPGTPLSGGPAGWRRIGYALENTTDAAQAGTRYSTGVVFKAAFHPAGVEGYSRGNTFFAIGHKVFASMERLMEWFYGKRPEEFDARVGACRTWADVKAFAAGELLANDPSGYRAFLLGQDEAADFGAAKEHLKWTAYMREHCGYSATTSGGIDTVTTGLGGIVTRRALRPYGVTTYEDAKCYYTWWVRHTDDGDPDRKGIMEYAVVRNNIYKLKVGSVYSLGSDVPGDDGQLRLEVYVNDWLLLDQEVLPL